MSMEEGLLHRHGTHMRKYEQAEAYSRKIIASEATAEMKAKWTSVTVIL